MRPAVTYHTDLLTKQRERNWNHGDCVVYTLNSDLAGATLTSYLGT